MKIKIGKRSIIVTALLREIEFFEFNDGQFSV